MRSLFLSIVFSQTLQAWRASAPLKSLVQRRPFRSGLQLTAEIPGAIYWEKRCGTQTQNKQWFLTLPSFLQSSCISTSVKGMSYGKWRFISTPDGEHFRKKEKKLCSSKAKRLLVPPARPSTRNRCMEMACFQRSLNASHWLGEKKQNGYMEAILHVGLVIEIITNVWLCVWHKNHSLILELVYWTTASKVQI